MIGVNSKMKDGNGKYVYSGQRLKLKEPTPGELSLDFPVSWGKYNGFQFMGRRLDQYTLEKYVIVKDISWWDKIRIKCV